MGLSHLSGEIAEHTHRLQGVNYHGYLVFTCPQLFIVIVFKQKGMMQTNRYINITGLQASNYDIFAKLSQLDVCKPTRNSPAPALLTDYVTRLQVTGGKLAL